MTSLTVTSLEAGYVRYLPILQAVNLRAEAAKLTVIIGPNGAGKSTLIKAIAGLIPVSDGRVMLGDQEITGIRPDQMVSHGLAYVPQTDNIFRHLTIRENLGLVLRRSPNAAARMGELFELFPDLGDKHSERAAALSGGQRQMLAVAMALANTPRVILLDEPSAGLSPKIAAEVLDLVRGLTAQGVTVLLVEQNVKQALRVADHCYILAEGRNQIDGPAAQIASDPVVGEIYLGGKTHGTDMIQSILDGILTGAIISLGAIGLTLIMHILRFANFAYAELLAIGAYVALVFDRLFPALVPVLDGAFKPLTLTGALALSMVIAMVLTGLSAVVIDALVFKRIRKKADPLSMVFASFGVALVIRNVIVLIFGHHSQLYSQEIARATVISFDPLILIKPDQVFVLLLALALMLGLHLILTRTTFGFALRAVAENPALAQVAGVRLSTMVAAVWIIAGSLSAVAGTLYALTNQLNPLIGHVFLLPVFAATIVGGIGSVYGAVLGGFIVGIASGLALMILPPGYAPAMPFLIILAVLLFRPQGLFGEDVQ